ncbi:MAG: hypothetical protein U0637_04290 [Phycisphaerales bacterium]
MKNLITHLDALLRGARTSHDAVSAAGFDLPMRAFFPLAIALGAVYGFFMGWYAVLRTWGKPNATDGMMQLLACIVKVPALFFCTLVVTFPSLYVFNSLVGCRLSFRATLRLLVATIVVNLAVASSLGPIIAFFTFSTESYHFMQLLNVAMLAIAGGISLGFLLRSLRRYQQFLSDADYLRRTTGGGTVDPEMPQSVQAMSQAREHVREKFPEDAAFAAAAAAARDRRIREEQLAGDPAGTIFKVWVVIYALVGAQMGWILRPFVGHPALPFEWFRPRSGNFFMSVVHAIGELFGR